MKVTKLNIILGVTKTVLSLCCRPQLCEITQSWIPLTDFFMMVKFDAWDTMLIPWISSISSITAPSVTKKVPLGVVGIASSPFNPDDVPGKTFVKKCNAFDDTNTTGSAKLLLIYRVCGLPKWQRSLTKRYSDGDRQKNGDTNDSDHCHCLSCFDLGWLIVCLLRNERENARNCEKSLGDL